MATARKLPRPFEMHWGAGEIVEEASFEGEWHEPSIQLMRWTEGEGAGGLSIRFCTYNHGGRFQRSPLMVSEADLDGLRKALLDTPQLRSILQSLLE